MQDGTKNNASILLLAFIVLIVLWFVLSRLHFVVFIPLSLGGFILIVLGIIVILYLVLDNFLTGSWQTVKVKIRFPCPGEDTPAMKN